MLDALARGGIDVAEVSRKLEDEGVDKFTQSFDKVMRLIGEKRKNFARERLESQPGTLI